MKIIFHKKLFFLLSSGFIFFTIVGTLTHELGHYIAARSKGYQAHIHFNSTTVAEEPLVSTADSIFITVMGPAVTLLFGTSAVVVLFTRRKKLSLVDPGVREWALIFFGLFWSRPIFNLAILLLGPFRQGNDETRISIALGQHYLFIPATTALAAALILGLIIFRVISNDLRLTFLASAFFGSLLGLFTWFYLLGPFILP